MRFSKTEVNLRRLLAVAPRQHNQAKLIHYITTLREQLEQLGQENIAEGVTSISKARLHEYSEQIEALAAKLVITTLEAPSVASEEAFVTKSMPKASVHATPFPKSSDHATFFPELRRRHVAHTDIERIEPVGKDSATAVKLDDSAQAHIEKHRKLQDDLTDEMVVLAQQLKESSLLMSQSLQDTEKILDSTEKAVEHSLASTGRANTRAMEVFTENSKTNCFTLLVIFAMICIFVMVVFLIRVT